MAHVLSLKSISIVPSKAILRWSDSVGHLLKLLKKQEIPSGTILSKKRYILLSKIPNWYFLHYFFAPLSHLPRNAFIIKMVYAESSIFLVSRVCTAGSNYLMPAVLLLFLKCWTKQEKTEEESSHAS